MKVALPYYVVGLLASFIFGLLSYYFPGFAFTPEQVLLATIFILAALGIDVAQLVVRVAVELRSLISNLRGQGILSPKESPYK